MRYGDFFSALSRYEKMSALSAMGSFLERYCVMTLPKRALWRNWRHPAAPPLNISERCRLSDEFCPGGYYRNLYPGWPETVVSRFNMQGNVVQISAPIFFKGWKRVKVHNSLVMTNSSHSSISMSIRVVDRESVVVSSSVLALAVQTWGVESRVIWRHYSQYIF